MTSLKDGLRKHYISWTIINYTSLPSLSNVHVPGRSDVVNWLKIVWDKISTIFVGKTLEYIDLAPTDVSPPDTTYPDTPFKFNSFQYWLLFHEKKQNRDVQNAVASFNFGSDGEQRRPKMKSVCSIFIELPLPSILIPYLDLQATPAQNQTK